MRCRECNVDLSENYTKCPLCGSKAYDDESRIKGVSPAPYPHGKADVTVIKPQKLRTPFSFEKVRAFFNL